MNTFSNLSTFRSWQKVAAINHANIKAAADLIYSGLDMTQPEIRKQSESFLRKICYLEALKSTEQIP